MAEVTEVAVEVAEVEVTETEVAVDVTETEVEVEVTEKGAGTVHTTLQTALPKMVRSPAGGYKYAPGLVPPSVTR